MGNTPPPPSLQNSSHHIVNAYLDKSKPPLPLLSDVDQPGVTLLRETQGQRPEPTHWRIPLPTGFRFYLFGWGMTACFLLILAKLGGLI